MTDQAKKIVELQRRIQQSFLNIEEYCNPKTLLDRNRAGNTIEFQLERAIESLSAEVAEIKEAKIDTAHIEVFAKELGYLEQSSARLGAILRLMNVMKTLRRMKSSDDAVKLIKKSTADFDEMRERYPFTKQDIESRVAHIVYCLYIGEVSRLQPLFPKARGDEKLNKRSSINMTKTDKFCAEAEKQARLAIDAPTSGLLSVGEIEQHNLFSTEKCLEAIKKAQTSDPTSKKEVLAGPHEWLASLKLEKCKISNRARKVLGCLTDLIALTPKQPQNLQIARSVSVIVQLYNTRAQPPNHCGIDAVIFFNDCLYLAVELERAKCKIMTEIPIDAFGFGTMLASLRKNARNTLIRDLAHIKAVLLSWSDKALQNYLDRKEGDSTKDEFANVLSQFKRFQRLWADVCSKNTYAWLMFSVSSHILNNLVDMLLALPDFERSTCSKVLPLVNEIVDTCSVHIRKCESDLKKKFTEIKLGKTLVKKADQLKEQMLASGADRSLIEIFDFKLVA